MRGTVVIGTLFNLIVTDIRPFASGPAKVSTSTISIVAEKLNECYNSSDFPISLI